LSAMIPHTGS